MTDLSEYVPLAEAARICGLSRNTLYYHLKTDNPPPSVKIGGLHYFHPEELRRWNTGRVFKAKKRRKHA